MRIGIVKGLNASCDTCIRPFLVLTRAGVAIRSPRLLTMYGKYSILKLPTELT